MLGITKTFARAGMNQFPIAYQFVPKSKTSIKTVSSNISTTNRSKLLITEPFKLAKIRKELQKPDVKPIFINDGRPTGTFYIATLGLLGLGLLSNVKTKKKELA